MVRRRWHGAHAVRTSNLLYFDELLCNLGTCSWQLNSCHYSSKNSLTLQVNDGNDAGIEDYAGSGGDGWFTSIEPGAVTCFSKFPSLAKMD